MRCVIWRVLPLIILTQSTIAVALWTLDETSVSPTLELVIDKILDGGVGHISVNNPTWEPRS